MMRLNSGSGELVINSAGEIAGFSIGDTVFAEGSGGSAVTLLYSEVSSQWDAKSWKELPPDSVSMTEEDGSIVLSYPSFEGKNVQVTLTLRSDENGFIADADVVNSDDGVAVGVKMFRMQGFKELGGTLYFPDRAGQKMDEPFKKLLSEKYGFSYPVPMSAQYITYSTGEKTWSVQVLDPEMRSKKIWLGDVFYAMEVEQYCFLEANQTEKLPSVRLNAYEGDWHRASDQYREWFDGWAKKVERSPLIDEMPTISSAVILARPEEDANLRDVTKDQELTTYDGALAQMSAFRIADGFEGSQLVGWHGTGHDTDYPLHEVSEIMGGSEGLKRLSAHMKNLGLQVGYYTNARLGNIASPIYDDIRQWMVKPADGLKIRECYGAEWFEILCPMSEGFIRLMEDKARELAGTYDADFMQLDQIGAAQSYLCFDATHGHSSPATAWAEGYARFIDRVTAAGREYNPGFWTWCEGAWEGAGQHLDLQQGGYWKFNSYSEYAPELYRYTFPNHALMGDAMLGGVCMWVGSENNPSVKLMKNYEEFYSKARFMDEDGLTWDGEAVEAKWHALDRAVAIVARNHGEASAKVRFTLDHALAEFPETFYVQDMRTGATLSANAKTPLELNLDAGEIGGLYLFW